MLNELNKLVGKFLPTVLGHNPSSPALEEAYGIIDELATISNKGDSFVGNALDCLAIASAIEIYQYHDNDFEPLRAYCLQYARAQYMHIIEELEAFANVLDIPELISITRIGHWHLKAGIQYCLPWACDIAEAVRDKVAALELSEIRDMTVDNLNYLDLLMSAGFVDCELTVEYIDRRDITIGFVEVSTRLIQEPSRSFVLDYAYGQYSAVELAEEAPFIFDKEIGQLGWLC